MAASADKPRWTQYENDHFIAYSDARKRTVLKLLTELEDFRSAFLQVSLINVPADAPKTTVLILRNRRDFSKMKPSSGTAAFAQNINGRTVIVMPASGSSMDSATIIRHEFAHALLAYKEFTYPAWFREGFAELTSTIDIDHSSQTFKLGEVIQRTETDGNLVLDWNELLDDDFDPHTMSNPRQGSLAYTQSWLLTHYAVLGNKGRNTPKLQAYFNLLTAGEPSLEAFESAFGMSPDEIWDEALEDYVRDLPVYVVNFRASAQDPEFRTTPAPTGKVEAMIAYYEKLSKTAGEPSLIKDPLQYLGGSWGLLDLDSSCSRPMQFFVDTESSRLVMSSIADNGRLASSGFTYRRDSDTSVSIEPIESEIGEGGFPELPLAMSLSAPAKDLICLNISIFQQPGCHYVMESCR